MANFYIDYQSRLMDNLMKLLRNDPWLQGIVGNSVYAQHLSFIENPTYPAITLFRAGYGSDPSILELDHAFLQIDVWSKKGPAELEKIYAYTDSNKVTHGIKDLLVNKQVEFNELIVGPMQELFVQGNLYQAWDKTWHLISKLRMFSAAKRIA